MPAGSATLLSMSGGGSYLVDQFRAFYAELMAIKKSVAAPRPSLATEEPAVPDPAVLAMAQSVSRQLLGVLELQAIEAQRAGGSHSFDINREAQYVMAALADEAMLRTEWPGRDVWTSCLIESALFQTRVAGDLFFDRLDDLLRTRDPARLELTLIYLFALSLGFEGRYRGTDCATRMQNYRAALYRLRFGRDADPTSPSLQVAPQTYSFTVGDAVPQQMPYIGRAVTVLIVVMICMLGLSQLLWEWKAGPLSQALKVTGTTSPVVQAKQQTPGK